MTGARALKDGPLYGADSRWSWITAFSCCWVLFLALATPRVSGIFFYGIVETFMVSREDASWAVSLAGALMALAGPIAGDLCERFSCRAVLLTCSSLAGIGAGLCYLAEDLLFIAISFGVVHGCALCGLYVAANVLLAQHFEKRRATACSLVYTACGLNTIVIPPLVEFFRTTYGVRGAFLLYGAVMLHAIPSVIILRSPVWLTKPKREPQKGKYEAVNDQTNAMCVLIHQTDEDANTAKLHQDNSGLQDQCSSCVHSATASFKSQQKESTAFQLQSKKSAKELERKKFLGRLECGSTARQFLSFTFLIHGLSFATVIFTTNIFCIIPADLARDKGMDPSNSVYVLQAFSVTDVAFRAVVGLAIDSRTLSLESVMLLGFALQGLAFEWLVWAGTLSPLIAAAALLGSAGGSRMCLQAPAMVRDFGISTLPMMMGGLSFCAGASLLIRPLLIGYFRDTHGDYTGLLHLMAAVNAFFVCIWSVKLFTRRRTISRLRSKSAAIRKRCMTDLPASLTENSCRGEY
ncbi:monocarboxylate transporter 3-like [Dermacentor silvarum]|uniref:monocarboxylate transporter 3-like n=1 Tax=Dermacentor silvarum TaxID=543639 RepID=UPI002100FCD2|nr:monocarboxylate transporter 3-like [Dermacentor silvarum]